MNDFIQLFYTVDYILYSKMIELLHTDKLRFRYFLQTNSSVLFSKTSSFILYSKILAYYYKLNKTFSIAVIFYTSFC